MIPHYSHLYDCYDHPDPVFSTPSLSHLAWVWIHEPPLHHSLDLEGH